MDTHHNDHGSDHGDGSNYLNATSGIWSWMFTIDHKRIGVMYTFGTIGAMMLGGLFALLVRLNLWVPDGVFDNNTYNQFFTLHGAVMVFLFVIPGIPGALGNFVLPLMLGAKDVAFPKINLLSLWLWAIGALFFVAVLVTGGIDTGWTFYTPYSVTNDSSMVFAVLGAFILGFSSIFTGLNFIVTVHRMRPKGMGWFNMPLFVWGIYSTAVIQVLATPVLGITLLMLAVEKMAGLGIFDPSLGGDAVLFQHFFWFYSHPAVYIMILPAMAIISELMATFSRKKVFGYTLVAYSSIAIAAFGFLVWGHHMFTSGQSAWAGLVFSTLTFSISIPSAIKVFNWLSTMYKGSVRLDTPMWYALAFLWMFTIGWLTGMFLGTMGTDVHLHDTYFVVSHFHYVMVGSIMFAFFGGLHYWWPKMFGKMYNEFMGKLGAVLIFLGFNVTFFPQFVMGSRGMPRRYANYLPEFQELHQVSTVGAFILGIGVAVGVWTLFSSIFLGKKAPDNPWGGTSMEWETATPPIEHNFHDTPSVKPVYDFSPLVYNEATGNWDRIAEESGDNHG
ncbi:MAG: cbb3-type cytochrome c oxidase subunit I [Planctomycetota bacterium]|nr:cbb3-type cytochrome c oxidase subunit I [Planctomycetota bacterium]